MRGGATGAVDFLTVAPWPVDEKAPREKDGRELLPLLDLRLAGVASAESELLRCSGVGLGSCKQFCGMYYVFVSL
mgnify:CR=1 FL=1